MRSPKTALVTGASSGIGLELARLLANDGYGLVLVGRDAERLEQVARQVQKDGCPFSKPLVEDLSDSCAADRIADELARAGIEIDVLVNCAGFNVYGAFSETDATQELQMLQVNVVSLTQLTKLLLPGMVGRECGRILNVGSTGSFACGPFDAVYCASKAYVLSFSEAIAEELSGSGVTVTALCPGATRTRFAERAGMSATRMFRGDLADPRRVAVVGYRALMRGRRVVVPGLLNAFMTTSIRFSPRTMVAMVSRRMLSMEGATR